MNIFRQSCWRKNVTARDTHLRVLKDLVARYYSIWSDPGVVDIPVDQWMRLLLTPVAKVPRQQFYRPGPEAQADIDKAMDALHDQGKASWMTTHTPSALPIFVAWRWFHGRRVGRAVVDCRAQNKLFIPDLYPLPRQDAIVKLARGKSFITVVDAARSDQRPSPEMGQHLQRSQSLSRERN
ncbi:hypothetical protein N7478_004747 [Penicillium angulare]|uniref:uncharacterized protein n=1 Tax=Penicillium angulare TaxID=116970 RepID=UPI002541373F|nr:uncharacterized protein N7478_004747 [Penicillium angulare]KAJ5279375.1 hypothetical protein N7478_004747 [Penicillium angulare]